MMRAMWRLAALLGLLTCSLSCSDPATQVLVWVAIEGEQVGARAATAHVQVFDQDGTSILDEERPLAELPLPFSVSVLPIDGDAERRYRVEITLLDGSGDAVASQTAEGSFVANELREIRLRFEDACIDVVCGLGRTCIDGTCQRACFEPTAPGSANRSEPGTCPCACECAGDRCEDGLCVPARPLVDVVAGFDHTCIVDPDGALHCFGDNARGQLGLGDREARDRPVRVDLEGSVSVVTGGEAHTCALVEGGALFCWGANSEGQLGTMPGEDVLAPVRVAESIGSFVHVDAGAMHTCGIIDGGTLFCWGRNSEGQLGAGVAGDPLPPTEVMASDSSLGGFTEVFAGVHHSCALQGSASRLWSWGVNSNGVLGREMPHDGSTPFPVPDQIPFAPGFRAAASGGWHVAAVGGDGGVYVWGDEANGRLGLDLMDSIGVNVPTMVMPGVGVAAGLRRTCVSSEDESVWCFGTNGSGELGVGSEALTAEVPVQMREERWEVLALGTAFTCGIRRGGALYCWGSNESGQLGLGDPSVDLSRTPRRVCFE
jgi:alpha-tubulin suppressor-like RCC1 family protein